jgi:hypothetical protein
MVPKWVLFFLVPAIVAFALLAPPDVAAQSDDQKADPSKCREVQAQLDAVMAIAQSTSLSEAEKMAKLEAAIAQSFVAMQSNAKNISEAAQIAREWTDTLKQMMASAMTPGAAPSDSVPSDAKTGLDIVKNRLKPYVQVMKVMCPDLVIPDIVNR